MWHFPFPSQRIEYSSSIILKFLKNNNNNSSRDDQEDGVGGNIAYQGKRINQK